MDTTAGDNEEVRKVPGATSWQICPQAYLLNVLNTDRDFFYKEHTSQQKLMRTATLAFEMVLLAVTVGLVSKSFWSMESKEI